MLASIRRYGRAIAFFLLMTILPGLFPTPSYALTSGPSQPETQQFAPAGMDNMVDPFTGDFSYNIPLLDVGGYPVNINYAAGITPDQESSWVGLGWNLNVGAVNRSVRGIPDDFAGDPVTTTYTVKPNQTFGLNFSFNPAKLELWGFKAGAAANMSLYYNNYNGFGFSMGVRPSIDLPISSSSNYKIGLGANIGLDSEGGASITPSVGLGPKQDKQNLETSLNATLSFPFSTREGLKGMTLAASGYTTSKNAEGKSRRHSSGNIGGFLGFASPTYTPSVSHDRINVNATVSLSAELTNPALEQGLIGIGGYYSGQFLQDARKASPAYGYMYEGLDGGNDRAMYDFNREKDNNGFNDATKNLGVTAHTYDIYSVSGQGVGGTYRLFRGDVGHVGDPVNTEQNHIGELGVGLGAGAAPSVKVNVDLKYSNVGTISSRWSNDRIQQFQNPAQVVNSNQERVYFRRIGEPAPETDGVFVSNVQKGAVPYTYNLIGSQGVLDGTLVPYRSENIGRVVTGPENRRTHRRKRNNQFTYITAAESGVATLSEGRDNTLAEAVQPIRNHKTGFQKKNIPASASQIFSYQYEELPRVDQYRKGHHITEIRVTDNSGARYHYGIPVYNNKQEEVTFSVATSNREQARQTGLVGYTPTEASEGNKSGLDHSFNKVETSPYATSYLLTAILSSDYVDSDGIPGPSDGDLGNYTKFNYIRTSSMFQWRTPYQEGMASFTDAMESKNNDDKANYLYGEKEIWYLHSIETRTHVAEFQLSKRQDGHGVKNDRGGLSKTDQNTLYKLDKIRLFAKTDLLNGQRVPLKTVHFDYDYTLCPNTPNSSASAPSYYAGHPGKGKLTLRKVWFTYGSSGKGMLNPYVFHYADTDFDGVPDNNPVYQLKEYDRWGNYKKQQAGAMRNEAFPYTDQVRDTADRYSAVYALTSIDTPTGGTIRVHYESDDYAYVQDKRAARMFRVLGLSSSAGGTRSNKIYDGPGNITGNLYLHVRLDERFRATSQAEANDIIRRQYLADMDLLYYKAKLNVINAASGVGEYREYVPGYTEIDISQSLAARSDTVSTGYYDIAVIKLKEDRTDGARSRDVHPIARNGWMYAKLYLPRELKDLKDADSLSVLGIVKTLLGQVDDILTFFTGFANVMAIRGNSDTIVPDESFVRLNDRDKIKYGGGHRVRAIVMADNWNRMTSRKETGGAKEAAFYGQKYDYVLTEKNVDGKPVSSGVTAWEPMLGNDENPFRRPVYTVKKVPLAPSREFYLEEPFGEMFFPAPTVGYSRIVTTPVRITGSAYDVKNLKGNGTGFVVQEFYTARDFPTITRQTDLVHKRDKPNLILTFLKLGSNDLVTCTQGYQIELNDMHGKEKSKMVMPDAPADGSDKIRPISAVEYHYKRLANGTLDNRVRYISPNQLTIEAETEAVQMGTEIDVIHDSKFYKSVTAGGGLDFNVKGIFPIIPIVVPFPLPTFNAEAIEFRSLVTTKVVNRYGILERTVATDNGQTITTRNLAWDKETGEVLLTRVENEFHDPIWNFTYPAYWAYPSMDPAYINEGIVFNTGSPEAIGAHLRDGDELLCRTSAGTGLGYYDAVRNRIVDDKGREITGITRMKIVRSGARNLPMTPIGTISCMDDPMRDGDRLQFTRVLNAAATEFKFVWRAVCNCGQDIDFANANPFVQGRRGSLRPWKNHTYMTERKQTRLNNNLDVRTDGYFTDEFRAFWSYASGRMNAPGEEELTRWQYVTEIMNYNPVGMEIENKDALGRYSMAQFGYGRNLAVATSNNSQYRETGFDGFEDYTYGDCNDDHFSWRAFGSDVLSEQEAHTGRKSIKVAKKSALKISKDIIECEER